jgi:hypothetical protein
MRNARGLSAAPLGASLSSKRYAPIHLRVIVLNGLSDSEIRSVHPYYPSNEKCFFEGKPIS